MDACLASCLACLASLAALLLLEPVGSEAVKIVALTVPDWAQLHRSAVLSCRYDTEGEPLYSVKWYRNRQEFYRYLSEENPKIRTFKMDGVHVDVAHSNDTTLHLSGVTFDTAGEYACEVSVDAPTFFTAVARARLNVMSPPARGPHITGLDDAYVLSQTFEANCTIGPAVPRASLRWYLNGKEVAREYVIAPDPGSAPTDNHVDGSTRVASPNWLALRLPVEAGLDGQVPRAELLCQSFVGDLPQSDSHFSFIKAQLPPGNQRLSQHGSRSAPPSYVGLLFLALLLASLQYIAL